MSYSQGRRDYRPTIVSFKDLIAWQRGMDLVVAVSVPCSVAEGRYD